MHNKLSLFALVLLLICSIFSVQAETGVVQGVGTATIDGVLDSAEWSGAGVVDFALDVRYASQVVPAHLYVMNDGSQLYLALKVDSQTALGWRDVVRFVLDRNGSLAVDQGDDSWTLESALYPPTGVFTSAFYDQYVPCPSCEALDSADGGTNDGAGAVGNDGSSTIFEVAHPLNSADDAHDINLFPNDRIMLVGGEVGLYASPERLRASGQLPKITIGISAAAEPKPISIAIWPLNKRQINLSADQISVAILSSADFDATQIDFSTIGFGKTGLENSLIDLKIRDLNKDRLPDLLVRLSPTQTGLMAGDKIAYLQAKTNAGQPLLGRVSVTIKR